MSENAWTIDSAFQRSCSPRLGSMVGSMNSIGPAPSTSRFGAFAASFFTSAAK
jgi:hypothetical protein